MANPNPTPMTHNTNWRDVEATVEDLTWLADHNVGATQAAQRAGFPTTDALEKWLRDHHRNDLMRRLRALEPISLHAPKSYHGRRSA